MAPRLLPLVAVLLLVACDRPSKEAPDPVADAPAWEGRYRLVRAGGDSLPALLDRRPGCSVQLVYGALTLQEGRFYFTDTTRERCEGEDSRQESWIAQGTVEALGETLRFHPDSGTAFSAAEGLFRGAEIRLLRLHTEGGIEEVDWLLVRRDRPGR